MKINKERLEMLKGIMAIEFSLVDLNLFLDTHPTDRKALTIFNEYTLKLCKLVNDYEKKFAPLTATTPSNCPWRWIEDPWPWEIDYEMGGK